MDGGKSRPARLIESGRMCGDEADQGWQRDDVFKEGEKDSPAHRPEEQPGVAAKTSREAGDGSTYAGTCVADRHASTAIGAGSPVGSRRDRAVSEPIEPGR